MIGSKLRIAVALLVLSSGGTSCAATQTAPPELIDVVAALEQPPVELDYAMNLAIAACLREEGFTVETPGFNDAPGDVYLGLVGVFRSEDEARTLGYRTTVRPSASFDDFESMLSKAEQARFAVALHGPEDAPRVELVSASTGMAIDASSQGCQAVASDAVFGSVHNRLEGVLLRNDALAATEGKSTDLSPGDGSNYTTCMSQAGYTVDGFNAFDVAQETFGQYRAVGDPPNSDEIAMALADYRCQQELGLISRLRDNYARRAGDWVMANEARLLAWNDTVEASLGRAKMIIEG